MPNWTDNHVVIRGSKETLDRFINDGVKCEDTSEGEYSFGSWIPRPETYNKYDTTNYTPSRLRQRLGQKLDPWKENSPVITEELIAEYAQAIEEQRKKYGVVGWYDWNHQNYGCKWDENFSINRIDDTTADFSVTTPWTAPSAFLATIAKRYPGLELEVDSHYEDGDNEWLTYTADGVVENDLDQFQSELDEYFTKRINEAEELDGQKMTDEYRDKCLQAKDWYIESHYWAHTTPESEFDSFEGNLNWIIPDIIDCQEEE